jgi:bifunctional DNA-binding transcriptional regulator/antitoxin component of YhaV-PrlF toxin-antitoxin module
MSKMKKGITKVVVAKTESESLRTTIPSHIVTLMGLKEKDSIEWIHSIEGNRVIVTIKKVDNNKNLR